MVQNSRDYYFCDFLPFFQNVCEIFPSDMPRIVGCQTLNEISHLLPVFPVLNSHILSR